jgi:hypothetical protein
VIHQTEVFFFSFLFFLGYLVLKREREFEELTNFARNVKCLECEEARPKRQLTGGEWECPQ